MKKIIIYISILGFFTTFILSGINEIQNKEYIDAGKLQSNGQLEEDEAIDLFLYLPVQ